MQIDTGAKFTKQALDNNKNQLFKIMKSAPIAGVYEGEDPAQWPNFFNFYMNFLRSQIGPRGECSKAVRAQMQKDPAFYDNLLSLIKMTHKSHIKDIFVQYKIYSPCKQYEEWLKLQDHLQSSQDSYKKIMDENSIMFNKIKEGMLNKRGQDYNYMAQIQNIRANYKQKIDNWRQMELELKAKVEADHNYIRYLELKQAMGQFFRMWKEADMRVGYQSIEKGDSFEKIVINNLMPLLLERAKIDDQHQKIKIQTNCRWYPKNLGQIDIAILVYKEPTQKWESEVLIECKSRLFDIREAYNQVAVLKQKGKTKLCTSLGILDVCENPSYFIVTTLPENPFLLPIQSKMKQTLQKAGKNISIDNLKSQDLYPMTKQCFKNVKSPLQWFLENDSDRIIVLNY